MRRYICILYRSKASFLLYTRLTDNNKPKQLKIRLTNEDNRRLLFRILRRALLTTLYYMQTKGSLGIGCPHARPPD